MKLKAVIAVSVLAIAAATGGWMYYRYESTPKNLELYGNVDTASKSGFPLAGTY